MNTLTSPYLGILLPAVNSDIEPEAAPYRDRLRAWGMDSTQAIATGVSAHNTEELKQIIHDHPEADFLVERQSFLIRNKTSRTA